LGAKSVHLIDDDAKGRTEKMESSDREISVDYYSFFLAKIETVLLFIVTRQVALAKMKKKNHAMRRSGPMNE